jgi:malate dehydrogenase
MSKIGFVGAGKVGASAAFSLIHMMEPDEMSIVDIVENLATGEAMDLNTAAAAMGKKTVIRGGKDYSLLAGSDIVVVAAGFPRKPGMTRVDLLTKNIDITRDVVKNIVAHAPAAHIFYVANPVDVLTYAAWKISGKPRNEVYGMGAFHDTVRLWDVLRDNYHVKSPDAYILGEHGETMFPARSVANVGNAKVEWATIGETVRGRAAKIIELKGATYYAPAVAIAIQVKSVLNNERRLLPTSCVLQGEYGLNDVAIGVPAILGRNGMERVVELPLDKDDAAHLHKSAAAVKEKIAEVADKIKA